MARDHDIRVLITGAAGFAGSGLARALLARGYTVTGLDIVPLASPTYSIVSCRTPASSTCGETDGL